MKRKVPVDSYLEARPLLRHIRIMERVMEAVDDNPEIRRFHTELHGAFLDILQEEFAPHALTFALALAEIEDAMPSVTKLAGGSRRFEKQKGRPPSGPASSCGIACRFDQSSLIDFFVFSRREDSLAWYSARQSPLSTMAQERYSLISMMTARMALPVGVFSYFERLPPKPPR